MKTYVRIGACLLAFTLPVLAFAAAGFRSTVDLMAKPDELTPLREITGGKSLEGKEFDPSKPTVAIVLGSDQTEVTDAIIPYRLFSEAGAYNVYTVAPDQELRTL